MPRWINPVGRVLVGLVLSAVFVLCLGAALIFLAKRVGPPLNVLGHGVIGPGGIIVTLTGGALEAFGIRSCPMAVREADQCPELFMLSTLMASFLFWWVVTFVTFTFWRRRRQHGLSRMQRLPLPAPNRQN